MLEQNPPVAGKQLAQQRAAAMREAVQEDEDALATGAPSRSAVAALTPGGRQSAPSLWARAISGLAADAQPKRRPSIAQRLSRLGEASEALPSVADDGVRSPRKRSRSDAVAAADAEGQDRETARSEKVKHKKHKHRRD